MPAQWMVAHFSVTHIVLPFESLTYRDFPTVVPRAEVLSYRTKAKTGDTQMNIFFRDWSAEADELC